MSKSSSETIPTGATGPRAEICRRVAEGIKSGAYGFQARFILRNEQPVEVWSYVYLDHQWHKRDDLAFGPGMLTELFEEFETIASRSVAEDWSCRRVVHADRIDFELKFHKDAIDAHAKNGLESYVMGLLFQGHHDTAQDARRRIRFQGH